MAFLHLEINPLNSWVIVFIVFIKLDEARMSGRYNGVTSSRCHDVCRCVLAEALVGSRFACGRLGRIREPGIASNVLELSENISALRCFAGVSMTLQKVGSLQALMSSHHRV